MKILYRAVLVSISLNVGIIYADNVIPGSPAWSTPVRGETSEIVGDESKVFSFPGSIKKYTQAEIDNKFEAPDWREGDHEANAQPPRERRPVADRLRYGLQISL